MIFSFEYINIVHNFVVLHRGLGLGERTPFDLFSETIVFFNGQLYVIEYFSQ